MRSKRIKIRGVKLLAVCFLFVAGCSNTYRRTFVVSGTYLTVTSADKRAAKIVYDEFKRLDAIFNPYDPDSEISQLHASIPHAVIVSYEMFELLELSQEVATLTQGSFDVTKGAVYQLWKELIHNGKDARFPSVDEVKRRLATSGIKYIESYRDEGRCAITKKGLRLDFSGIAKGYMVDKAIAKLKEAGIESALIDAGGDIYCLGADNGKPWRVGVSEPVP